MRTFILSTTTVGLMLLAANGRAANSDLDIHVIPKKLDEKTNAASTSSSHLSEHWTYEVSVENRTFKDLTGVDVKYVIFYKKEELGKRTADKPERQTGSFTVGALKSHEKKSFTTNSVELKKAHLNNGYYFEDGGRQAAQDTLGGIWVRVMQGATQIGEYANPSILLKEKWD